MDKIATAISEHPEHNDAGLDATTIERALAVLAEARAAADEQDWLTHTDAHFLNVLHLGQETDQPWRLIDPIPFRGFREIEPIPLLRNRFDDAAATGDADRALRRRLDIMVDSLSLDRGLARQLCGAVAVDNLGWLLPRDPGHMFVAPYRVLAGWLAT